MSLSWIFDGVEYPLDTGEYYHQGNAGFGMAPVERFESQGPLQHGATDEGYRLIPRNIQLLLAISGETWEQFYTKRSEILRLFKPSTRTGSLRWVVGSLTRQIDCHYVDGMTFPTEDRIGLVQKIGFILRCPDPTWYDPVAKSYSFTMSEIGAGTPVPTPVPTPVGASSIAESLAISYTGTAISYPHVIRINGPIVNPVITNQSTGELLDLTGIALGTGQYIQFDLRYGYKTVVDHNGLNRISDLTDESDLSTFAMQPAPDVANGINTLAVTGSGTNDLTRIDIIYYDRFIGI